MPRRNGHDRVCAPRSLSHHWPRPVRGFACHARSIAERAGADVEFVHANVYDARQAVSGNFDLVYTSIGVLCWLPNIARWAQVIASLLKPGGTFFIRDDHPMFMTIGEDISDGLKIEAPYFEQDAPMTWDDDSSYVDFPDAPRITHTTNHQWNHSLGQIVTALINAGLVIDELEETPRAAWCPWPELMEQDPLEAGTSRQTRAPAPSVHVHRTQKLTVRAAVLDL